MSRFGIIFDEAGKMARTPKRLREIFRPRRWRQFFSVLLFNARAGNHWKSAPDQQPFKQREYDSYEQYVRHQQSKFPHLDLAEYDVHYRRQLKERLQSLPFLRRGATVLCLGARQGTEVKAFHDLSCFAVGIDLNPGAENQWVIYGDFHHIQFPDESTDMVFTNSFDHVFDPEKMMGEIKRILKPGGMLIVEAIRGEAEEIEPDPYASFWWQRVDDLAAFISRHGFQPGQRVSFQQPWPGEQICFTKAGDDVSL